MDKIKVALQALLPQHGLSRLVGWFTRLRAPKAFLRAVVAVFSRLYDVNLVEADVPEGGFSNFDQFFTRPLKEGSRKIDADPLSLVSPVDGRVSAVGPIAEGTLIQAKGKSYPLAELLGDGEEARSCEGGTFATLYLSPRDYHRIHAPCELSVQRMLYLPGRLFSVNPATVRAKEGLFSQNERVTLLGQTPQGPLAIVFVGALIVGSIEVPWEGVVAPGEDRRKGPREWAYENPVSVKKGEEIGRFHMGSTVILVLPPGTGRLEGLESGAPVRLGQVVGRLTG